LLCRVQKSQAQRLGWVPRLPATVVYSKRMFPQ